LFFRLEDELEFMNIDALEERVDAILAQQPAVVAEN
jgi:hypothetical protein